MCSSEVSLVWDRFFAFDQVSFGVIRLVLSYHMQNIVVRDWSYGRTIFYRERRG